MLNSLFRQPRHVYCLSLSFIRVSSLCSLLTVFIGCSGGRPPPLEPQRSVNHVSDRVSKDLIEKLSETEILLLGETHDHPQHHLIQAEVIERLKPKSVAFEMINASQQEALDQLKDTPREEWDKALAWSKRGWPDFELYRPVFNAALKVGAKLIAAHPDHRVIAPLTLGSDLPKALRDRLKLDLPLPDAHRETMLEEIRIAHCGHAPPSIAEAMLKAQRLKDSWMADSLLKAPHPSILIVGRGHVHPQRGIPWAIKSLDPTQANGVHVLSLGAERQAFSPSDADKVSQLLIAPHRTDDPCERFKEQLKRLKERARKHSSVK